jgi:hypothetical protein
MARSKTTLALAAAAVAIGLAALAAVSVYSPANADAGPAPCTCSAPVELLTGNLPTSPRASITHCECGAQSCAVLNNQALECSK